MQIVHSQHTRK